jgi:hypothetical protein
MLRPTVTLALTALLFSACTGTTEGGTGGPGTTTPPGNGMVPPGGGGTNPPGGGGTNPPGSTTPAPASDAPGPTPLRRLTVSEYSNTIRDLLGVTLPADAQFAGDLDSYQSGFNRGSAISTGSDARQFFDASDRVTALALPRLPDLVPCKGAPAARADQDACAKDFITKFGLRAYRRPVSADEAADLFKLYTADRDLGNDFPDAITAVISGILQSPYFLYRWELNGPPIRDANLIRFNSYEMASRLSYYLWASMPDDALFTAAANNQLSTPAQIEQQARRMMADNRFKDTVRSFHLQWLNMGAVPQLQKDPSYTSWSPAVAAATLDETAEFANHILFGSGATGKVEDLLTSPVSYVTADLAKVYGATVSGAGLQQVNLNPKQRAGIFTQAAFLASHSNPDTDHPIRRGVEILRHAFCVDIDIPKDIQVPTVDQKPGLSSRDTFAMHAVDPKCTGCHAMIDPLGYAFEHYDAIGGWRDTDAGKPVDSTGKASIKGVSLDFQDAIGMVGQLAKSPEVKSCMTNEWMRYMVRRHEASGDEASLQAANDAFSKSSFDLRELIVNLTKTRAFTHRSPSAGEVLQ